MPRAILHVMSLLLMVCLLIIVKAQPLNAQQHKSGLQDAHQKSYSGEERRVIKALSEEMIENYQQGRGMGLAKAAELNHYPGPMHILELKKTLALSPDQEQRIEQAYSVMHEEAVKLGKELIAQEMALDALFAEVKADSLSVRQITARIGELQAAIRFSHLHAHIKAQTILTKEQIMVYDQARGYAESPKPKSIRRRK